MNRQQETIVKTISDWFEHAQRPLPWREQSATAWHVVMSEFMLQQTPVVRVLPVYERFVTQFPVPSAMAATTQAHVVTEWGRLGYPRRAVRLHQLSQVLAEKFDDAVPESEEVLLSLPGIGQYTAAAIRAFAFGQHSVVVDTNVRRVLARAHQGAQWPAASLNRQEMAIAAEYVPDDHRAASRWNAAVMELGAIVCTAASPTCDVCPIATLCAWNAAGKPQSPRPHTTQKWHGTDRQCRGKIVQLLREVEVASDKHIFDLWHDEVQCRKNLTALESEGMIRKSDAGWMLA